MRQFFASLFEVVEVAVVALAAVFVIRTFLVQPFLVDGDSMVPNFANGDYLLIDELTYRFRPPSRGEVIVFRYPERPSTYFIKRIVGVPHDRLELRDSHVVVVSRELPEGKVLDEAYLPSGLQTTARPGGKTEFTLNDHQYFLLGDNRPRSFDSREWGILDQKEIVGLVRLRLWPPGGFRVFAAPQYEN